MVTFSRAYPRVAFWYGILVHPFVMMFVYLFKLTWLVSKGMTLATVWIYRAAFMGARKAIAKRNLALDLRS